MLVVDIAAFVVGIIGIGLSLWRWRQMLNWKKAFYYGELVIGYNNRVVSRIKLVELYQWCWQLSGDKRWKGDTFFKRNKVSLSITRPLNPPSKVETVWRRVKRGRSILPLIRGGKVVANDK